MIRALVAKNKLPAAVALLLVLLVLQQLISAYLLLPPSQSSLLNYAIPESEGIASSLHAECQTRRPTSWAVIHMGVHKTGSSSIQNDSGNYWHQLREDGFEMPWTLYEELTSKDEREAEQKLNNGEVLKNNQVNFATCFMSPTNPIKERFPCMQDLLLKGLLVAERGYNLLVSAETFATIHENGIHDLRAYLKSWDQVLVVVFYRRFFSWVSSLHNQMMKYRKWNDTNIWDCSIRHFLSYALKDPAEDIGSSRNEWSCEPLFRDILLDGYTVDLVERLQPHFLNITVLNFHDDTKGGPPENFFCNALPTVSRHTCKAIQNQSSPTAVNTAVSLDYSDIAYGAWKAGLVKIDSEQNLNQLTRRVGWYNEVRLNQTAIDFPRVCPTADELQKLWSKSLNYEKRLFPELYQNRTDSHVSSPFLGETAMKDDFKIHSRFKLCAVDVDAVLSERQWQQFFANFKYA